jgi:hypothetical protein
MASQSSRAGLAETLPSELRIADFAVVGGLSSKDLVFDSSLTYAKTGGLALLSGGSAFLLVGALGLGLVDGDLLLHGGGNDIGGNGCKSGFVSKVK